MLEFLNSIPDNLMPYFGLMAIALFLSFASMIWYGIYAWHEHHVEKAGMRKTHHRHRINPGQ